MEMQMLERSPKMPEQVMKFKAEDGTLHDSYEEAVEHEKCVNLAHSLMSAGCVATKTPPYFTPSMDFWIQIAARLRKFYTITHKDEEKLALENANAGKKES
jgi:hypothetical protein